MRIKKIHIDNYKNLEDFSIDFSGGGFLDIFVGKNGTGKSNLFEALIEVFRQLYEEDHPVSFDYSLEFSKGGNDYLIKWDWSSQRWLDASGNEIQKIDRTALPDNIVVYYSGHNEKIGELLQDYLLEFRKGLKTANEGDIREFIGIGKEYKSLLIAVLLVQPDSCQAKQYILEKLGITEIVNELRIDLARPYYAKDGRFDVDPLEPESKFWRAEGITKTFLDLLDSVNKTSVSGVREEGFIPAKDADNPDRYVLFYDLKDLQQKMSEMSAQELFRNLDNLKTIEMLDDISLNVKLQNGQEIDIGQFSDGQFQSVYIYTVAELFKDVECLTLLDEPDSFLHPEWQFRFLEQISEITKASSVNNHLLMTTHSPSTLVKFQEPVLNIFEMDDQGKVHCHGMSKSEIIHSLSAGLITLTENEATLNINHFMENTTGAVLFTEGISDELILETAFEKLYPGTEPNFNIQNAFDCSFLRNLIKRGSLFQNNPGRTIFSLFDFDEAYGDWVQLGADVETDHHKGLVKKHAIHDSYAMLLPVPHNSITGQVINPNTGGDFGKNSLLTIELLFIDVPGLQQYFQVDISRTDGFKEFVGDKVDFAQNVVPGIDSAHFEVFRPMFEFINNKIN